MAYTLTQGANAPAFGGASGFFAIFAKSFADWMLYRRTVTELAHLSPRELADLGMSSTDIPRVAFESVYGG